MTNLEFRLWLIKTTALHNAQNSMIAAASDAMIIPTRKRVLLEEVYHYNGHSVTDLHPSWCACRCCTLKKQYVERKKAIHRLRKRLYDDTDPYVELTFERVKYRFSSVAHYVVYLDESYKKEIQDLRDAYYATKRVVDYLVR